MTATDLANVTTLAEYTGRHRAADDEPRTLSYQYCDHMPTDGLLRTEWLIEQQLAEGLPPTAFGLMVDKRLANQIEELFDLADAVCAAEDGSVAGYHAAIDSYAFALRTLAQTVRNVR